MDPNRLAIKTRSSAASNQNTAMSAPLSTASYYLGKVSSTPSNTEASQIHPGAYFPSPNTENSSFIGNEGTTVHGLTNSMDFSRNKSLNQKSMPLLANNNINNISSNSNSCENMNRTNNTVNNSNSSANFNLNNEDVMSYQRVKKVVYTETNNENMLRAKEKMLNHLKSIDLSKFSFPNENKPRTDYTYARSSSYLTESKGARNDNCVMPNLCRRGRKSPQSSGTLNHIKETIFGIVSSSDSSTAQNANQNISPPSTSSSTASKSASPNNKPKIITFSANTNNLELIGNNKNNQGGWFKSLTNIFSKSYSNSNSASYTTYQTQQQPNYNSQSKLNKNLLQDLEDDNNQSINKAQSASFVDFSLRNLIKTTTTSTSTTSSAGTNTTQANNSSAALSGGHFLRSKISSSQLNNRQMSPPDNLPRNIYIKNNVNSSKKSSKCWYLIIMMLLIALACLLPLFFQEENELNTISETDSNIFYSSFDKIKKYSTHVEQYFEPYLDIEFIKEQSSSAYQHCTYYLSLLIDNLIEIFNYLFNNLIQLMQILSNIFTKTFQSALILAVKIKNNFYTFQSDLKTSNAELGDNQYDKLALENHLNEIKERMIIDLKAQQTHVNVDQIREELDQKFNLTLTLMSKQLADQSIQLEVSKSTHEKEIQKLKEDFRKLEMDFRKMKEETVTAASSRNEPVVSQSNTMTISFKDIEEYINKTFFLYNADRTGMTDFASESLGASILFTRCTENYLDGSRWLTFFNLPISRITASPRVVIQGPIQPGNCWAFKGSKADLFIKLAAPITPKSFSMEHIPKELSLTGLIDSAPQNFSVFGYVNSEDIKDENRILFGNFRYDNTSSNPLQFFNIQHEYLEKPITAVELLIESNAGNPDYTCLYKFRVHGHLFKQNSAQNEHIKEVEDKKSEKKESTEK